MIESQKTAVDIEVFYLIVKKDLIVKLQILNSSIDYTILASTNGPPHHGLGVKITHKNKNKGVRLAIKYLYEFMKE